VTGKPISLAQRRIARALAVAIVVAVASVIWTEWAYGIAAVWQRPEVMRVCGIEYGLGLPTPGTHPQEWEGALILHPVLFELPVLVPPFAGNDQSKPYGGCPTVIVLRLPGGDAIYGPEAAP
jgi:hypothetical protein